MGGRGRGAGAPYPPQNQNTEIILLRVGLKTAKKSKTSSATIPNDDIHFLLDNHQTFNRDELATRWSK